MTTCGLRTDNTITCWGSNWDGQSDAPSGTFKAVTVGRADTCGLRTDNTITCWGFSDYAPNGSFKAVTGGSGNHTCGLRTDNTITCWGSNSQHRLAAPSGTYSAVTGSGNHTCGLRTDSTVTCWGSNDFGQADPPGAALSSEQCGMSPYEGVACWGADYYRLQADGVADSNPGVFLTRENEVSRFVKNEVVDKHADDNPWLMEVWNHTNRPDFQYTGTEHFGNVRRQLKYNRRLFPEISAISLNLNPRSLEVPVAAHEMAHVYTLVTNVSEHPAPIAIGLLYFALLYDPPGINRPDMSPGGIGSCVAEEMYADAATRLIAPQGFAFYWRICPVMPDFVTEEAAAVVRSAFSGEMPQWLYETFGGADGSLDYEAIWSAVKGLYNRPHPEEDYFFSETAVVVYQLKDAFGGYCSDLHTAFESALGRSTLTQPWRDGGC